MIEPVSFCHDDYEKLVDELMYLDKYILKFNVILGSLDKDGNKRSFHNEFRYRSNKYQNKKALNTIKRNFNYYLSIESITQDEIGNKDFIMIRAQDMYYLRSQLNNAMKWFTSSEFKDLYVYKDNQLIIQGRPNPIEIQGLYQGKYILLSPIIMEYNGTFTEGIRFVLNNSNCFDLSVDRYCALVYLLSSFDMYMAASLLLSYFGHPDFGKNLFTFGHQNDDININTDTVSNGRTGRNPSKNKFFD